MRASIINIASVHKGLNQFNAALKLELDVMLCFYLLFFC